jgi:hypothetical protein
MIILFVFVANKESNRESCILLFSILNMGLRFLVLDFGKGFVAMMKILILSFSLKYHRGTYFTSFVAFVLVLFPYEAYKLFEYLRDVAYTIPTTGLLRFVSRWVLFVFERCADIINNAADVNLEPVGHQHEPVGYQHEPVGQQN